MEQTKALTRQEQIDDLQEQYDKRKAREQELGKQLNELLKSLQIMDKAKAEQIEQTLDQLPDEKRGQLLGNIKKLEIAVSNENRKANQAHLKKKELEKEIVEQENDAFSKVVNDIYLEVIDAYRDCRKLFYSKLLPVVQEAYDKDKFFYKRFERLGLNKSIMISIESHLRQGEVISLEDFIEKVLNLSDAYGETLLKKMESFGSWPSNPESYFGYEDSLKPPHRDAE